MMQAQVVQQPAFVTYAPQPQYVLMPATRSVELADLFNRVVIQQPMVQAQYVVPAGLQ